jgi:hypothetical protein
VVATNSPPQRSAPRQLPAAARGTLKLFVAIAAILLVTVLPLPTLYVVVVSLMAIRLLLQPQ